MKTDMGNCQNIQLSLYLDCKERTKKKIDFARSDNGYLTADEKLVRFLLANSSITEHDGARSFDGVREAIGVMCHQLCPGQWCTRKHCSKWDGGSAYYCTKTRPAVCGEYKKYVAGVEERKSWRYLIVSECTNEIVGCCSSDHRLSWGEKRVRCYGNCEGCEDLNRKQTNPNKKKL